MGVPPPVFWGTAPSEPSAPSHDTSGSPATATTRPRPPAGGDSGLTPASASASTQPAARARGGDIVITAASTALPTVPEAEGALEYFGDSGGDCGGRGAVQGVSEAAPRASANHQTHVRGGGDANGGGDSKRQGQVDGRGGKGGETKATVTPPRNAQGRLCSSACVDCAQVHKCVQSVTDRACFMRYFLICFL